LLRRSATNWPSFAVVVPVGPQPLEVERLIDLAESLAAYETGPAWFVMVDDSPVRRSLQDIIELPPGLTSIALHHVRDHRPVRFRHGGGLCSPVLTALKWVQANTNARFVLKLDTDSLVINPVCERLSRVFDVNPSLGMVGAHTLSPDGSKRLWDFHGATVMRMLKPPFDWRRPLRGFRGEEPTNEQAALIRRALANGYEPGEHCLGGGYALSRTMLDRMAEAGYLDEPRQWTQVDLAEDVMIGIHARAVGSSLANQVRPGEVFGVRYQGLHALPKQLVEEGFGVIHSVKNDSRMTEPDIRAFFKRRRLGTTSSITAGMTVSRRCA
jgi:hypothetical protein